MAPVSRSFHGRRPAVDPARVPPGQYVTQEFPVLSAGPTPFTPLERWSFTIRGEVDQPVSWTWEELNAQPSPAASAINEEQDYIHDVNRIAIDRGSQHRYGDLRRRGRARPTRSGRRRGGDRPQGLGVRRHHLATVVGQGP
jgi:hypothetical protein